MFTFFRKPQSSHPTKALAQALASDGLPPGMDPATLTVLEQRGSYSGRRVRYFRVFDPLRVAEQALPIHLFADLDTHPDLVLSSGHIEQDGAVVVTRTHRQNGQSVGDTVRGGADRAKHGDDERFVFPDGAPVGPA